MAGAFVLKRLNPLSHLVDMQGLQGHLRLVCARDHKGQAYLKTQSFRAPLHLSKPYWNGHALLVNLVSPTAGLLAGDQVSCHVQVEKGAHLILTTPSATRIHTMPNGVAQWSQHFEVQAGGFLEYFPEILIPQRDAVFTQTTNICVEPGGELFFLESLAPGRVASGESFAFRQLKIRLRIRWDSQLVAYENILLDSTSQRLNGWLAVFPQAYLATCYCFSPQLDVALPCWQAITDLHHESAWVGVSRLAAGGWVVKMLAEDNTQLRKTVSAVREILLAAMGRPVSALRRY